MNKQIEALKMAIEALWSCTMHMNIEHSDYLYEDTIKAHNICKEALAEAESESSSQPVAWMEIKEDAGFKEIKVWQEPVSKQSIPLYTHPATWQSLSDDEIFELHHKWIINSGNKDTQYDFARSIEQALKEKNHD